ncbi:hypothetical protein AB0G67_40680 [Streptomyces sp. NPDC021056]|uniref:hypothetical protein n=1 Tax=Streptomyces sp. NPDC021056 TaxID=3155012 RepID=UPI0033C3EBC7
MARINVYSYAETEYDETTLQGWFNDDSSTLYKEATRWDGNNHVSVNPVGRHGHQALYRTKGGRWVLNTWSQWQGSEDRYEFIDDSVAKDWLLRNDEDDAVEQHFGELEEESGPNLGGRPSIGPKVEVRIPKDILARVDAFKGTRDRADALRDLIAAGLDALAAAEK